MKKVLAIFALAGLLAACNSGENKAATADSVKADTTAKAVDTTKAAVDTTKKAADTTKAKM